MEKLQNFIALKNRVCPSPEAQASPGLALLQLFTCPCKVKVGLILSSHSIICHLKKRNTALVKKKEAKTRQDLPFQNQNEAHTGLLRRSWLPTVGGEAQDLVNQSLSRRESGCQLQPLHTWSLNTKPQGMSGLWQLQEHVQDWHCRMQCAPGKESGASQGRKAVSFYRKLFSLCSLQNMSRCFYILKFKPLFDLNLCQKRGFPVLFANRL